MSSLKYVFGHIHIAFTDKIYRKDIYIGQQGGLVAAHCFILFAVLLLRLMDLV